MRRIDLSDCTLPDRAAADRGSTLQAGSKHAVGKTIKNSALASAVVAVLLGTSVALAQTPADEHAGHHPEGATPSPSAAELPAQGMGGGAGGMMGGGMKMGGGMPGGTGATPGAQGGAPMDDGMMKQMMMNHQAMQGRTDMMEMMMGQMLQNQEAQHNVKPAK